MKEKFEGGSVSKFEGGSVSMSSIFESPYVLDELLAYLGPWDVLNHASLVSKAWLKSARKEYVWFKMSIVLGIHVAKVGPSFQRKRITDGIMYEPPDPCMASSWKQLCLRNVCIHLPPSMDECTEIAQRLSFEQKEVPNMRCSECRNLSVWLCLTCNAKLCGRAQNKHMLGHFEALEHCVVMQARDLQVWCFACDRFLGENQMVKKSEEIQKVRLLQKSLLNEDLFLHREHKRLFI